MKLTKDGKVDKRTVKNPGRVHHTGPWRKAAMEAGWKAEAERKAKASEGAMKEHLEKIMHDLEFAVDGFQQALTKASNVESIIILDMVRRTSELHRNVEGLLIAHIADHKEKA